MSDHDVIETTDTHRVRLVQDIDCTNPRDDDEFACGALVIPGSDYNDVPHPGDLAEEAGPRLFGDYGTYFGHAADGRGIRDGVAIFERWVRVFHGGATLYDTPYDGPSVVWYMTPEMMRARGFEGDMATDTARMEEILEAERNEYRAWAEGDCWGVVVEKRVHWTTEDEDVDDRDTWEETEDGSVWGFIGYEYAEAEARTMLASYAEPVATEPVVITSLIRGDDGILRVPDRSAELHAKRAAERAETEEN